MINEYVTACKRSFNGGKSKFAAAVDFIFFSLLNFIALYIVIKQLFDNILLVTITTGIATAILSLIFSIRKNMRFEKHVDSLRKNARNEILHMKLLCLPAQSFKEMIETELNEECYPFQKYVPLEPNDVFEIVRNFSQEGKLSIHIVSISGLSDETKKIINSIKTLEIKHTIINELPSVLDKIEISEDEITNLIIQQNKKPDHKRVKIMPRNIFLPDRAKKYAILGLTFYLLSFVVRYGLYMQIVSAIAFTAAGAVLIMNTIRMDTVQTEHRST